MLANTPLPYNVRDVANTPLAYNVRDGDQSSYLSQF